MTSVEAKLIGSTVEGIRGDIAEMKTDIREMTQAISQLAALEQQHLETKHALERAFGKIGDLEDRLRPIEIALPALIETRKWVVTMVLGALALMLLAVAALVLRPATVLPITIDPPPHIAPSR